MRFFKLLVLSLLFYSSAYGVKDGGFNFPHFFSRSYHDSSQFILRTGHGNFRFHSKGTEISFLGQNSDSQKIGFKKSCAITEGAETVSIEFLGRNTGCKLEGFEPLASRTSFLYGSDDSKWVRGLLNYNQLFYRGLYEGIDLRYYVNSGEVKYDFVIGPHVDLNMIRMKYSGIRHLMVNADCSLEIHTDSRIIYDHIPRSYQIINGVEVEVKVQYILIDENTVGFDAASYDPDYPLIVDPVLVYSSFIGGTDDEYQWVGGIDHDANGNIYHTGRTFSIDFPSTPGSVQTTFGGSYDVFVFKLDPSGTNLIYSTFIGGNATDAGYSVKVEQSTGNVWIVGATDSPTFPVTAGAFQTLPGGTGLTDAFVLKLNSLGTSILYSTLFGEVFSEYGHGIDVDNLGNVYIAGETSGSAYTTPGAFQSVYAGGPWDGWVVKFDPSLSTVLSSTLFGGNQEDVPISILVDQNYDVIIAGFQSGGGMPVTAGSFDISYNGGAWDAFVAKFNSNFSALIYSTYLGTSGIDMIWNALKLTSLGEAVVAGFAGNGFPTTPGTFQTNFAGGITDAFIAKLNQTGSALTFSTYLGGTGTDQAYGLFLDSLDNIYVTGFCHDNFPVTECTYDSTFNGGQDVFLSKLNSAANSLEFSTYIGGSSNDLGYCITVHNNIMYLTGETRSIDFPTTVNSLDTIHNGSRDIFALAMSHSLFPVVAEFQSPSSVCVNDTVRFINNSINATDYYWDFGDGFTSSDVNPTHTFLSSGVFIVKLFAGSHCLDPDTFLITINVSSSPVPSFSYSTSCDLLVQFYNSSSGGTAYHWDFGDSTNSSDNSPARSYSMPGTYIVELWTTGSSGCIDSFSQEIVVPPEAVSVFNLLTTPCQTSITTQNNSTNSTVSYWNFGDGGSSFDSDPAHTYLLPGNYTVSLVVDPGNCPDTSFQNISIDTVPVAEFSHIAECNLNVQFTDLSQYNYLSTWEFGDSNISGDLNPLHAYDSVGVYLVTLIVRGSQNCYDTIQKAIVIENNPVADFNFDTAACNTIVQFQNLSTSSQGCIWTFGDGFMSNEHSPAYEYATAGMYNIELIVSPQFCPDTARRSIQVLEPPVVDFNFVNNCDLSVSFQNNSDTMAHFFWSFGDGNFDNSYSPMHLYNSSGTYDITLTAAKNESCLDSLTRNLNLSEFINADFSTVYDTCLSLVKFYHHSANANSYYWNFGDGVSSASPEPEHKYTARGFMEIIFTTNRDSECSDSSTTTIRISSIPEYGVYIPDCFTPNGDGLNDEFLIIDYGNCSQYTLSVFNRWGELIFETNDLSVPWKGEYKGEMVQSDVYIWFLKTDESYRNGKIVVLK